MPMPNFLPAVYGEPVIPAGYAFLAVTLQDPDAPVAIMGWPTVRRDGPDGAVSHHPVTPEAVLARIHQEGLAVRSWRVIRYEDIPKDRTYRDAWKDLGTTPLAHDLTRAKAIHRDHLRHARLPKLAELDVDYQRADEQHDQAAKQRVAAAKQALRDLPADPAIDAAATIDALKAVWPEDLT
jgi:hypothetical protein